MISGPSGIPVRTFKDVINYDYTVITDSNYFMKMLQAAKPGTPKNIVFNSYFRVIDQNNKTRKIAAMEALKSVISDSKILLYATEAFLAYTDDPTYNKLVDKVVALKMDDTLYTIGTLGLQKDSEFLQIFNYYILREMESGFLRRLYREHHPDLFTKENFEMIPPQPLGINNVMFCFILLGFGICLSLLSTAVEFIMPKQSWEQFCTTKRHKTVEPRGVQKEGKRSAQWETREIKFVDGTRSSVEKRNDKMDGPDGDCGKERYEGPQMKTLSLIEIQ